MKKNPFGMYDGIETGKETALPVEESVVEDVEKINVGAEELRDPEYSVSRSYNVPNGRYLVRARAKARSHNDDHRARWMLDAEEFQVYDTQLIPTGWSENDSGWIDDVPVDDGKLSLTFTLSRNNNQLKRAYIEWVEFSYRRKE